MYVNGSDVICGGSELQFQEDGQDFPGNKCAIPGTAQPAILFDRQTHLDCDHRQQAGKKWEIRFHPMQTAPLSGSSALPTAFPSRS
jgi:hypothetical protein